MLKTDMEKPAGKIQEVLLQKLLENLRNLGGAPVEIIGITLRYFGRNSGSKFGSLEKSSGEILNKKKISCKAI